MTPFAPREWRSYGGAKDDNTAAMDSMVLTVLGASDGKWHVLKNGNTPPLMEGFWPAEFFVNCPEK